MRAICWYPLGSPSPQHTHTYTPCRKECQINQNGPSFYSRLELTHDTGVEKKQGGWGAALSYSEGTQLSRDGSGRVKSRPEEKRYPGCSLGSSGANHLCCDPSTEVKPDTSTTRPKQATPLILFSHFHLLLDVIAVLD